VDTSESRSASEVSAGSVRPRRRWAVEEKVRIVLETLEPGVSVPVVARRHCVNANQLFIWRRQYQRRELRTDPSAEPKVRLLPVQVELPAAPASVTHVPEEACPEPAGCMQIQFCGGAHVKVWGSIDEKVLRTLIRELLRPC